MKVYIAGKITGEPDYKLKFSKAEKMLKNADCLVMNPATLPEGFPWKAYMPICYSMIDQCEAIYMLSNWQESKGAKLELDYAKTKKLKIYYELPKMDLKTIIEKGLCEELVVTVVDKCLSSLTNKIVSRSSYLINEADSVEYEENEIRLSFTESTLSILNIQLTQEDVFESDRVEKFIIDGSVTIYYGITLKNQDEISERLVHER